MYVCEKYLSNIRTDLPDLRQKLQPGHPLRRGESGLARKVVEVRDESLEDVLHPLVLAERVDADNILGDVVHREVFHRRDFDLGGIHCRFLFLLSQIRGGINWVYFPLFGAERVYKRGMAWTKSPRMGEKDGCNGCIMINKQ